MAMNEVLLNMALTALIAGLAVLLLSLIGGLLLRQFEIARWRKNFGDGVGNTVVTTKKILKRSVVVGVGWFVLLLTVQLLEAVPCLNAILKNKADLSQYCENDNSN